VKGVADFLDLAKGLKSIGPEHLLENRWALLRLGACRNDQYRDRESQKTDHVETTQICD
jgi:hypothetical protein